MRPAHPRRAALGLLAQDLILVEGASVVNLMAVWRAHGLPQIMRKLVAARRIWRDREVPW